MNADPTDQGARFDTDLDLGALFPLKVAQENVNFAWHKFKDSHQEEDLAVWHHWCRVFADMLYEARLRILRKTGE